MNRTDLAGTALGVGIVFAAMALADRRLRSAATRSLDRLARLRRVGCLATLVTWLTLGAIVTSVGSVSGNAATAVAVVAVAALYLGVLATLIGSWAQSERSRRLS